MAGVQVWLGMRGGVLLRHRKYRFVGETTQEAVDLQSVLSQQSITI